LINPNSHFRLVELVPYVNPGVGDLSKKGRCGINRWIFKNGHESPGKTLVGFKRLMKIVHYGGGTLSVVLAGHPKLKNHLRRPVMEEIGNRATVFSLDNVLGANREYIYWFLKQCVKLDTAPNKLFQDEAVDLLAEKLATGPPGLPNPIASILNGGSVAKLVQVRV
jgi:type II secretory pathway predicted ATPase ExeA